MLPYLDDLTSSLRREYCSRRFRAIDSMIYLTYRCTSRCKTCNIWKRDTDGAASSELGWDEWKVILSKLVSYGIETLEIFGGDALLRKDIIFDVIRYCNDNGIDTYFPTNSLLIDGETAERLVDSGLGTIYFSLDDVAADNDAIRGQPGAFEQVRQAISGVCAKRGPDRRPRVIICTTISKLNFRHFEEIVRFIDEFPVDAIYPRVVGEFADENIRASVVDGVTPEPYFITTDEDSHLLTHEELVEWREIVARIKSSRSPGRAYINFRAVDIAGDDAFTRGVHPDRRCLICSTFVTIDPFGGVTPCPMFNKFTIGNLLTGRLEDIWGNEKHRRFVDQQRARGIKICSNCIMRDYYPTFPEVCGNLIKRATG